MNAVLKFSAKHYYTYELKIEPRGTRLRDIKIIFT